MTEEVLRKSYNDFYKCDMSNYPYINILTKSRQPTNEEFEEYINLLDDIYDNCDRFGFIMETDGNTPFLKAEQRIKIGNWTKKRKETIAQKCKGCAFLISSFLQETMLRGIFLIQKPPYEYILEKDRAKCTEWLRQQLEK